MIVFLRNPPCLSRIWNKGGFLTSIPLIFRTKYSKFMYYSVRRRRIFFGVIFCIIDRSAKKWYVSHPLFQNMVWNGRIIKILGYLLVRFSYPTDGNSASHKNIPSRDRRAVDLSSQGVLILEDRNLRIHLVRRLRQVGLARKHSV